MVTEGCFIKEKSPGRSCLTFTLRHGRWVPRRRRSTPPACRAWPTSYDRFFSGGQTPKESVNIDPSIFALPSQLLPRCARLGLLAQPLAQAAFAR